MQLKKLLLSILVSGAAVQAFAQDEEPMGILTENGFVRYISIGVGGVYQSFRDEAISKSIYEGYSASPLLKSVKTKENALSEISLQASRMNFTRDSDPLLEQKINVLRIGADYRYLHALPLFDDGKKLLLVGGQLSGMFSYKNAPAMAFSSHVYEYAATLGPSARFMKKFERKQRYSNVSLDVSIPLLAYTARPSYLNRTSVLGTDKMRSGDFFSDAKLGSISNLFRLNAGLSYMYMMENGNAINIGYSWDYYHINNQTEAYFASHTLSLSFMFNY